MRWRVLSGAPSLMCQEWYTRRMKCMVVANWKMYPESVVEAKVLARTSRKVLAKAPGVSLVIAPPAVYLRELAKDRSSVGWAVQRARAERSGPFTGDISLVQAKDARATHVIIGHAESRAAGETNALVRERVAAALALGLTPVVCVGEEQRTPDGAHFRFIEEQLRFALADVSATTIKKVILAYEPLWAIGAAKPISTRDMHEMSIFLRKSAVALAGPTAMNLRILYGGSVDETTAAPMILEGDVAGLLVGRASLDAERFAALLISVASA